MRCATASTFLSLVLAAVPGYAGELIWRDNLVDSTASSAEGVNLGPVAGEPVRVDAAVLAAAPEGLWLELAPGDRRWAERIEIAQTGKELERTTENGFVWRGRFVGSDPRYAGITLSLHDGHVFGYLESGEDVYTLRAGRDGKGLLTRLDPGAIACAVDREPWAHGTDDAPAPSAMEVAVGGEPPTAAVDDRPLVGILAIYRPQLAEYLGDDAFVVAFARSVVDLLNTTLVNSDVPGRAYLAGAYPLAASALVWSGSIPTALAYARDDFTIAALRNQTGGDVVSLIMEPGYPGGCTVAYGYQMTRDYVGVQMAPRAINGGCYLQSPLTFAHEVGHNLGAHHDPAVTNVAPPHLNSYPWSYGYICCGEPAEFATVMSYGSPRLAQFSNPRLTFGGEPTGVPEERDNARTLSLTMPIAAAFYPGEPPPGQHPEPPPRPAKPPTAPRKLTAKVLGPTEVTLAWRDLARNEDLYAVEMKYDGITVEYRIEANSTRLVVDELSPGKTYTFRVRARNAAGSSLYSNVARAKTRNR